MKTGTQLTDLTGRCIIVTGAGEKSIGFATALALAQRGAHVTVSTRSNTASVVAVLRNIVDSSLGAGNIDGHDLDLTQAGSVAAFVRWYGETHDRLDVLINNAGVHLDLRSEWKTPPLTADGHEIHWRTNYLGTAQLTALLLPLLLQTAKQTGDTRVVNVVSQLHSKGSNAALFSPQQPYNSWRAYGTSKLALVHHALEIQRRYNAQGLQAYCLHPGAVYTRIADKGLAGHPFIAVMRKLLAPVEALILLSPEKGARTSVYCATEPGLQGGHYFDRCAVAPHHQDADDTQISERLWDETQRWLQTLHKDKAT